MVENVADTQTFTAISNDSGNNIVVKESNAQNQEENKLDLLQIRDKSV